MKTRLGIGLGAAVLVGATTLITTEVVSRQHDVDMEAMWTAWMKLAEPGPEHRKLMRSSGSWLQETTYWPQPGIEPTKSEALATMEPIMGGRFMLERVQGQMEFAGEQRFFEGLGIFGYDNLREKHVYAWVDNHGTMIMTGEGTADADGNVTYYSAVPNPMGGSDIEIKSIFRIVNDDAVEFAMYEKRGGSWFRNMEIVSKRAR